MGTRAIGWHRHRGMHMAQALALGVVPAHSRDAAGEEKPVVMQLPQSVLKNALSRMKMKQLDLCLSLTGAFLDGLKCSLLHHIALAIWASTLAVRILGRWICACCRPSIFALLFLCAILFT